MQNQVSQDVRARIVCIITSVLLFVWALFIIGTPFWKSDYYIAALLVAGGISILLSLKSKKNKKFSPRLRLQFRDIAIFLASIIGYVICIIVLDVLCNEVGIQPTLQQFQYYVVLGCGRSRVWFAIIACCTAISLNCFHNVYPSRNQVEDAGLSWDSFKRKQVTKFRMISGILVAFGLIYLGVGINITDTLFVIVLGALMYIKSILLYEAWQKSISGFISLGIGAICIATALFSNMLTLTYNFGIYAQCRGIDILSRIGNALNIAIGRITGNSRQTFVALIFSDFLKIGFDFGADTQQIASLFAATISISILIFVMGILWLVQARKDFSGSKKSGYVKVAITGISVIALFVVLSVFSNTITSVASKLGIPVKIATETLIFVILTILLLAAYIIFNHPKVRKTISAKMTSALSQNENDSDQNESADNVDTLLKYQKLLESGVITEEEYQQKKCVLFAPDERPKHE